ncbi:transcription termination/antitermination protein NusG [Candidatus Cytomitobacter primus]|uniref:Transcription termination/antitermination protein NusG n=1 Tax=Candidatus Cytomitobacter primus TaxID=2066024 RepID=A0A5C0UE53_9PROT|nr:transcription termination/antitermination NusG family protein [Candidatus Cytomitobacter primus]QEK38366.1 hypothetical protein FZC34_00300 [Candidatus Cytomitobacter primus]
MRKVSYKIKISHGFEEKFHEFLEQNEKLFIEYGIVSLDEFEVQFKNDILYDEFYRAISQSIDIVSSQKVDDVLKSKGSHWYAVGVVSSHEISVSKKFDDYAAMHEEIEEVFVPQSESIVWVDQSTSKSVQECLSPGYIFIKAQHSEHIMRAAKNIRVKVSVLSNIVSDKEINAMKVRNQEDCNLGQKHSYSIGDPVYICAGPFKNYKGSIEEIDEENSKQLKVTLSVLGREIPVRLAFSEVRKMEV